MGRRLFIVLLALFIRIDGSVCGAAPAETGGHAVTALGGRFSYLLPAAVVWQESVKAQLPFDTLLNVDEGASVEIKELGASAAPERAPARTLQLAGPILLRLTRGFMLDYGKSNFYANDITSLKAHDTSHDVEQLGRNISMAWHKIVMIFVDTIKNRQEKEFMTNAGTQRAAELPSKREIRLITPKEKEVIVSSGIPARIAVKWEGAPIGDTYYQVYVWADHTTPKTPKAITNSDRGQVIMIKKSGAYWVRVASADKRFESAARPFFVHFGTPLPEAARVADGKISQGLPASIKLTFPPERFAYHSSRLPVSVPFRWQCDAAEEKSFRMVITDPDGKEIYQRDTSAAEDNISFTKAGPYRWHIESADRFLRSETREFTLIGGPAAAPDISAIFRAKGTVYLDLR